MADIFPQSVQGAGTVKIVFLTTVANPAAPTLTELNAADALDVTPYFRADAFDIGLDQERLDDTRLSDESKREGLGLSTYSVDALRYVYNPQALANAAGNKAVGAFAPGATGYFYIRYGSKLLKSGAAFASSQRIGLGLAVTFGDQLRKIPTGDNAVHIIEQQLTLTKVLDDYAIPA